MKAAHFSRFGGPEVLEIVELPDPHRGAGEVRIAVCQPLPHAPGHVVFSSLWRPFSAERRDEGVGMMKRIARYETERGRWQVERRSDRLYRVSSDEGIQGYVERVGPVWVSLEGERLDRCVEIGQSLTLEGATSKLLPK